MENTILILCADARETRNLQSLLKGLGAPSLAFSKKEKMAEAIGRTPCLAALIDLDSVPLRSRHIKQLVSPSPGLMILCVSRSRYHPELADAISTDIHACIAKPVNPEELRFWLKSLREKKGEDQK
ncbi:MAG: hypothetical protein HZB23_12115 [Deltaproteobacteria bacterium]|nr:hypothetical protein [Deltaproteobacteria bacterium]